MVSESEDPEITIAAHEPKGIFSEEFRPCWYLVAIPGVTIALTLIVVGVRKLARDYLTNLLRPDKSSVDVTSPAPAVVVEDFETGQVSHRTSISVASQPIVVNLARRLSDVSTLGALGPNGNLVDSPSTNILEMYSHPSRPATAFTACRRTSCINL